MIGEIAMGAVGLAGLLGGGVFASVRAYKDHGRWLAARQAARAYGEQRARDDGLEAAMRAVLADTEHVVEDAAHEALREGRR